MDEEPRVAGFTQAYCTTCKSVREHVVVAMVGGRPAKVECVSCHKQHLFRAAAPGTKTTGTKAPRTGTSRARKAAVPEAPPVDIAALTAGRPQRDYDPRLRFSVGDVVAHPSFGTGLVTLLPGPQKVEIAFQSGAKLLAHDRAALVVAGLVRPPRRDEENAPRVSDAPPNRGKL